MLRVMAFAIATPLVIVFFYMESVEAMMGSSNHLEDIPMLVINSMSLVVIVMGIVFMRGHNNRMTLAIDATAGVLAWTLSYKVQVFLSQYTMQIENGSFLQKHWTYLLAQWMPACFLCAVFILLSTRVQWENKALFTIGRCVKRLQPYVLNAVSSKGTTNYHTFVLINYLAMTLVTAIKACWYMMTLLYFGLEKAASSGYPTRYVDEYFGFSMNRGVDALINYWLAIAAVCTMYYIAVDYFRPDQFGSRYKSIQNFVGSGKKVMNWD